MQTLVLNPISLDLNPNRPRPAPALPAEVACLLWEGRVPKELEGIFRRGEEWESGVELVAALARAPGAEDGDVAEVLTLTQQLAQSSAYGAVQVSAGPCLGLAPGGGAAAAAAGAAAGQQPDYVLMARFSTAEQLAAFRGSGPMAALAAGDASMPLAVLWQAVLTVVPVDHPQGNPPRKEGLL